MRRQHLLAGLGLMLGLLTLAGCGALYEALYQDFEQRESDVAGVVDALLAESPSYLYTLTAAQGTFVSDGTKGCGDGEKCGGYVLTLSGLVGNVMSFTDRPNRIADHETLAEFVGDWETLGFVDDPPNAALVLHEEDETRDVAIVELREPVYDPNGDTLTFAAMVLHDEQTGALAEYFDKADGVLPAAFGTCSLLIDNARTGCAVTIAASDVSPGVASIEVYNADAGVIATRTRYAVQPGVAVVLGDAVALFTLEMDYTSRGYEYGYKDYYFVTCPDDGQSYMFTVTQITHRELPAGFGIKHGRWTFREGMGVLD